MFVIGSNRKKFENQGVNCICLHMSVVREMVAPSVRFDTQPFMFQCLFAPVTFLDGTAVSCLLLVKHYDQRCRLPYQKLSGHPAVLSSCSLFATSRLFLSSKEVIDGVDKEYVHESTVRVTNITFLEEKFLCN